ncbi:hypothetical protein T492DRAFT_841323 [Pavlovales sp. CCMP2436]|nr:hypothetical protein T492DRAFT_841323 [Pavlovales sp. CCMP2436]
MALKKSKKREYKRINTSAQLRRLQDEANRRRAAQAARIADREGQLWFESKIAEGKERLWPIAGIVASIWLYLGAIRTRIFTLAGSARNVGVEEHPNCIMRKLTCSNFQMLADFCDWSGKGSRSLGASRECKSGAINTLLELELTHRRMFKPGPMGYCREYCDIGVKFTHVNTVGTVTAVSVAPADRLLVTCHLRSLPDQFDVDRKSVNPAMLDVMDEVILAQTTAARSTVAQPQRTQPSASARLALSLSGGGCARCGRGGGVGAIGTRRDAAVPLQQVRAVRWGSGGVRGGVRESGSPVRSSRPARGGGRVGLGAAGEGFAGRLAPEPPPLAEQPRPPPEPPPPLAEQPRPPPEPPPPLAVLPPFPNEPPPLLAALQPARALTGKALLGCPNTPGGDASFTRGQAESATPLAESQSRELTLWATTAAQATLIAELNASRIADQFECGKRKRLEDDLGELAKDNALLHQELAHFSQSRPGAALLGARERASQAETALAAKVAARAAGEATAAARLATAASDAAAAAAGHSALVLALERKLACETLLRHNMSEANLREQQAACDGRVAIGKLRGSLTTAGRSKLSIEEDARLHQELHAVEKKAAAAERCAAVMARKLASRAEKEHALAVKLAATLEKQTEAVRQRLSAALAAAQSELAHNKAAGNAPSLPSSRRRRAARNRRVARAAAAQVSPREGDAEGGVGVLTGPVGAAGVRTKNAHSCTVRRWRADARNRLSEDINAYDEEKQGEVVAIMVHKWSKLPVDQRPPGANQLIREFEHTRFKAAVKALTEKNGTFCLARCARIKHWDGKKNPRHVLLAGDAGTSWSADILGPYFPSAAQLADRNYAQRDRIGLTVRLSAEGRIASVDEVSAAQFVFVQSARASAGGFVVGASSAAGVCCLVFSSDAGCFASHGQQRSWTCAVLRDACRSDGNCSTDAAVHLDVGAVSDKAAGLDVLFETHNDGLNFVSGHKQLPCCAGRLALVLSVCVCKESSPPRAAWTLCCFVYTGNLVNLHAVLGLGSHCTDPSRFSTHVIKDATGVLRDVLTAHRLAHSIVGVACPSCNYTPRSEDNVVSEHKKRDAMGQAARQEHLKSHFNQWNVPAQAMQRMAARNAARGDARPEVAQLAAAQRLSRGVNACKALDALWKVALRTFRTGEVVSQYITEDYVRTMAKGVSYTVHKKSCATLQVLSQQIDYLHTIAAAATENRTAWNKQAHHGPKAWKEDRAHPGELYAG